MQVSLKLLSKAIYKPKYHIRHDQTSTFPETQQQHFIHKDQHDANIRVYGWEHFFNHNNEKYFKIAPRRGIEPRSPGWQAGILPNILKRTGNNWFALEFILSWRPKIERSLKYICCTYFDRMQQYLRSFVLVWKGRPHFRLRSIYQHHAHTWFATVLSRIFFKIQVIVVIYKQGNLNNAVWTVDISNTE